MSTASDTGITQALKLLDAASPFEVSEEQIVDAITNLLHLAWVGTTDDGEGMQPDELLERAVMHFEAERGVGDDLAQWIN